MRGTQGRLTALVPRGFFWHCEAVATAEAAFFWHCEAVATAEATAVAATTRSTSSTCVPRAGPSRTGSSRSVLAFAHASEHALLHAQASPKRILAEFACFRPSGEMLNQLSTAHRQVHVSIFSNTIIHVQNCLSLPCSFLLAFPSPCLSTCSFLLCPPVCCGCGSGGSGGIGRKRGSGK